MCAVCFFFNQKTAYEMRISDWSSDVCSSDLSSATVASAGGRYFGFVTGGALPATVAAQYLAAAWDQNSFSFVSSPAVACFETAALRWVKEALELPHDAEGALVTGATMAHFTCLAAARTRVLGQDRKSDA